MHTAAPWAEYSPSAHAVQESEPLVDEKEPAEQSVHSQDPSLDTFPAAQAVHSAAPANEYEPASHTSQDVAFVFECFPMSQIEQLAAPAPGATVPALWWWRVVRIRASA